LESCSSDVRSEASARFKKHKVFVPVIELKTLIRAPTALVFDLAGSVDAHTQSQSLHAERAVAGRTSGLMELGESVTWEAVHFGVRQRLTSRIVSMTKPSHFRDSMTHGAFEAFDHDHYFEHVEDAAGAATRMRDVFAYKTPLGFLGNIADALFLERYMRALLEGRNRVLRVLAEGSSAEVVSDKT
jgi:ligand-binding SRPBCC domain-containing protein